MRGQLKTTYNKTKCTYANSIFFTETWVLCTRNRFILNTNVQLNVLVDLFINSFQGTSLFEISALHKYIHMFISSFLFFYYSVFDICDFIKWLNEWDYIHVLSSHFHQYNLNRNFLNYSIVISRNGSFTQIGKLNIRTLNEHTWLKRPVVTR